MHNDFVVGISIFFAVAFVIIAYIAVKHRPEGGWLGDPLPRLAEEGEKNPDIQPPESPEPLDLEI